MESRVAQLFLNDEEEEELAITGHRTELEVPDLCLIGRFLTDKAINFQATKHCMAGVWRLGRRVTITELKPMVYLFKFFHMVDLQRVLEMGPWSFDGHPFVLHHLKPGESPTTVPLVQVPFWVQIYDLPGGFMSTGVGEQPGNYIGKYMEALLCSGKKLPYVPFSTFLTITWILKLVSRMVSNGASQDIMAFLKETDVEGLGI